MVILPHGALLPLRVLHRLLPHLAMRTVNLFTFKQFIEVQDGAAFPVQTLVRQEPGAAGAEEIFQHHLVPFLDRQAIQHRRRPVGTASRLRLQAQSRPPAPVPEQVPNLFRRGRLTDQSPLPRRQHRRQRQSWVASPVGHPSQPGILFEHLVGITAHLPQAPVGHSDTLRMKLFLSDNLINVR